MAVFHRKINRLAPVHYLGTGNYSLTIATSGRKIVFVSKNVVTYHLSVLGQSAIKRNFDIIAYCYMPDHVHLLVSGKETTSDLTAFVRSYKQITGYQYRKQIGDFLWQKSFYDHILRREESFREVVRYILGNPVRKQMVERPEDYPYSGSLVYGQDIFKC